MTRDGTQVDLGGKRTYSWSDPALSAAQRRDVSGLDYVQAILRGEAEMPPAASTVDMWLVEAGSGFVVMEARPDEYQYNLNGTVHGGIISAWLDSALGYAVQTTQPERTGFTTLDLTVRFIRAVTVDMGVVRMYGYAEHTGRTTATARAELRDGGGRLLATASTTGMAVRHDR